MSKYWSLQVYKVTIIYETAHMIPKRSYMVPQFGPLPSLKGIDGISRGSAITGPYEGTMKFPKSMLVWTVKEESPILATDFTLRIEGVGVFSCLGFRF